MLVAMARESSTPSTPSIGASKASKAGVQPRGSPAMLGVVATVVWMAVCTGYLVKDLRGGVPWLSQGPNLVALAIGAFLFSKAWHALGRSRRYKGSLLRCNPEVAQAGRPLHVDLLLPPGAPPPQSGGQVVMRLLQERTDDSGSSSTTYHAWEQRATAPAQQRADGWRVAVSFEPPAGSPASGTRRDGDRVRWLVELLDGGGRTELGFEVQVGAGDPAAAAAVWAGAESAVDDDGSGAADVPTPGSLPAGVTLHETPAGAELRFRRRAARVFAVLWLGSAVAAVLWARAEALTGGANGEPGVAGALLPAAGAWLLLLLAVHAGTVRWRLRVNDDGADIDRSSWLWPRVRHVTTAELAQLTHRLVYSASGGSSRNMVEHHSVYAQGPGGIGPKLTPAVPLASGAQAVAAWVRQALRHRHPRFAPGAQRPASGPSVPAWAAVLAWLAVAAAGLAIVVFGLR